MVNLKFIKNEIYFKIFNVAVFTIYLKVLCYTFELKKKKKKLLNYLSQESANKSRTLFCFDKSFELVVILLFSN